MAMEEMKDLLPLQQMDVTFQHNGKCEDYTMIVSAIDDLLTIEVVQKVNALRWRGEFSATQIEQLTRQTRNFKKFSVFVRMLSAAQKSSSSSVWIDLLTFDDLQEMRMKNNGGSRPIPANAEVLREKRYLVLTYNVEFDRIHWPLPLLPCKDSIETILRCTVASLRKELSALRASLGKSRIETDNNESDSTSKIIEIAHAREMELKAANVSLSERLSAVQTDLLHLSRTIQSEREEFKVYKTQVNKNKCEAKGQIEELKKRNSELLQHKSRTRSRSKSMRSQSPIPRFDPTAFVANRKSKLRQSRERKFREEEIMRGSSIRSRSRSRMSNKSNKQIKEKKRQISQNNKKGSVELTTRDSTQEQLQNSSALDLLNSVSMQSQNNEILNSVSMQSQHNEKCDSPTMKTNEQYDEVLHHNDKENNRLVKNCQDREFGQTTIEIPMNYPDMMKKISPEVSPKTKGAIDTSLEIAEIDDRLNKLQNFLKAAKAGHAATFPRS
eukprot:GSMAST32.ASY1.ANO1.1249.1 assembled CDS